MNPNTHDEVRIVVGGTSYEFVFVANRVRLSLFVLAYNNYPLHLTQPTVHNCGRF